MELPPDVRSGPGYFLNIFRYFLDFKYNNHVFRRFLHGKIDPQILRILSLVYDNFFFSTLFSNKSLDFIVFHLRERPRTPGDQKKNKKQN